MVDINRTANKILSPIKNAGASLCYQYPESFEKLPAVSFFNLLTAEEFRADNVEVSQLARLQIDIWAQKKTQPGELAIKINELMQADGWIRELDRDLPREENHVYHRTMRFAKEIYNE
ncbi:MAG: hypothetical protein ACI4DY_13915 [Monoglobaceae bacterium]